MNLNLSEKSLQDLHKTVEAFFNNEGDDGAEVADQILTQVKSGTYTVELWDALGCDDLGLVKKNKELQSLYKTVSNSWSKSLKKTTTKH